MGILPDALFNFLTLLGWSPGNDRELLMRDEAAQIFDLSDVNKAPAVFDPEKLLWMNGQYLQRMSADEIYPHLARLVAGNPLETIRAAIELNKMRARTLVDLASQLEPFIIDDDAIEYDADAVGKHLKGDDLASRMRNLHDALASLASFDVTTTEQALRGLAESSGVGAAKLIHPLRLALTGRGASPPIFDVAVVLGKEKTLRRLARLVARVETRAT